MFQAPNIVLRAATSLCLAIACLSCSTPGRDAQVPSGTGFPLAYFYDDCAPWDGRALAIVLSHVAMDAPFDLSYPVVRVTSWRPPEVLSGASVEWSGDAHDLGYASWCDSEEACRTASRVRVRFDREQVSSEELSGEVYLEFEDRPAVAGFFKAVRLPQGSFCGG